MWCKVEFTPAEQGSAYTFAGQSSPLAAGQAGGVFTSCVGMAVIGFTGHTEEDSNLWCHLGYLVAGDDHNYRCIVVHVQGWS